MRMLLIVMLLAVPQKAAASTEGLACLALNIYHEARGESVEGQKAVGWVVMNRVADKRWADNVCDVVYQKYQFSWTIKPNAIRNWDAYERSLLIAEAIIAHRESDNTQGATHYFANGGANKISAPYWAKSFKTTKIIGNHKFQR